MELSIALTLCLGMFLVFIYLISGIKACRDRRFIKARLNGEVEPPSTKKVRPFKEKIIIIHDGKREELVKGGGTRTAFPSTVMFTKEGKKVQGKLTDVWSEESTGGGKTLIPVFAARSSSPSSSDSQYVEPAGQHAAAGYDPVCEGFAAETRANTAAEPRAKTISISLKRSDTNAISVTQILIDAASKINVMKGMLKVCSFVLARAN
ncbi:uncharacterized protein [Littorina saxatilis]|uniref:uncharacterized protein n=1 Tax=Littorina saxatilis TaxID=31220 RepID=UPI0038B50C96